MVSHCTDGHRHRRHTHFHHLYAALKYIIGVRVENLNCFRNAQNRRQHSQRRGAYHFRVCHEGVHFRYYIVSVALIYINSCECYFFSYIHTYYFSYYSVSVCVLGPVECVLVICNRSVRGELCSSAWAANFREIFRIVECFTLFRFTTDSD